MRRLTARGILFAECAVCVALSGVVFCAPLYLVKDGKPQAEIVVQKKIDARLASVDEFTFAGKYDVPPIKIGKTLQEYIERITGATLPIKEERSETKGAKIEVGLTEFVKSLEIPFGKYDRDAIIVRRVGKHIVLVGVDDWGTEMAVYDFLERVCGVRWFMPGPLGEIVPQSEELSVGKLSVMEEPSFVSRMMSGVHIQSMGGR